jgi:hypothetical protein
MGLKPAYERVRVARALEGLPLIREAYGAGRMSWSQVRAVTRVATEADQQTWIDCARYSTGGQLERLVRGVRRAKAAAEDDADPTAAAHRMRSTTRYDPDGTLVVTLRFAAEDGAVFLAALDTAREDLDRRRHDDSSAEERTPAPATRSDAALAMSRTLLDTQASTRPEAARRSRVRLVAQVDPLSGWGRLLDGEILPPTSLADTITTLPGRGMRLRPLTDEDLARLDLGRRSRTPNLALRELLGCSTGNDAASPAAPAAASSTPTTSPNGATAAPPT